MSLTTKILLVGPQNAGKTVLAKYIFSRDADDLAFLENNMEEKEFEAFKMDLGSEGDVSTYPLRIHERNIEDFQLSSGAVVSVNVQIWDVSGDLERMRDKLEVVCGNALGAVFVYNPGRQGHGELLDHWFRELENLLPSSAEKILYPYKMPDQKQSSRAVHPKLTSRVRTVEDCNAYERDSIRRMHTEFNQMLRKVVDRQYTRREKQERSLMNTNNY